MNIVSGQNIKLSVYVTHRQKDDILRPIPKDQTGPYCSYSAQRTGVDPKYTTLLVGATLGGGILPRHNVYGVFSFYD